MPKKEEGVFWNINPWVRPPNWTFVLAELGILISMIFLLIAVVSTFDQVFIFIGAVVGAFLFYWLVFRTQLYVLKYALHELKGKKRILFSLKPEDRPAKPLVAILAFIMIIGFLADVAFVVYAVILTGSVLFGLNVLIVLPLVYLVCVRPLLYALISDYERS